MPIKKSAVLLLLLAGCSTGALVFTSYKYDKPVGDPTNISPVKCSQQCKDSKTPLPWNIISPTMFSVS